MSGRPKAVVNASRSNWERVFAEAVRRELHELVDFDEAGIPDRMSEELLREQAAGAEVMLSTWGVTRITAGVLDVCPRLRYVIHGAGSVKGFCSDELAARGIRVFSAVHLNARPVAEFCLGMILASLKNVFSYKRIFLERGPAAWWGEREDFHGGYYRKNIGLIGYGAISRYLLELLRPFTSAFTLRRVT